jgi:hypothetical protein
MRKQVADKKIWMPEKFQISKKLRSKFYFMLGNLDD